MKRHGKRGQSVMNRLTLIQKNKIHLFVFFLLWFAIYGYCIERIYGFFIYPDEFGYWASAAKILGYDWSEVASLGSYYSYGYSLLLIPLLAFLKEPVMIYRAAVGVNIILLCASMGILASLLKRASKQYIEDDKKYVLIAAFASFYPACIFYMQMTMTEVLLSALYISLIYIIFLYQQSNKLSILLAAALLIVTIYSVHMRTVGILIAFVLIIIFHEIREKESGKRLLFVLGVLIGLLFLSHYSKQVIEQSVFRGASVEALEVNGYGGQWDKLRHLLSFEGLRLLAISLIGKVLYLGLSSFGMFYYGMYRLVKESFEYIRRKTSNYLSLFILLSVIGQILITSIYTMEGARIDTLTYGRYNEYFLPVIIAFGCLHLMKRGSENNQERRKKIGRVILSFLFFLIIEGTAVVCILHEIERRELTVIQGYFMIGMSYLLKDNNFLPRQFYLQAYLLGAFLTVAVVFLFLAAGKKKKYQFLIAIGIFLEVMLGIQASEHYIYPYNSLSYHDLKLAGEIRSMVIEDESIVYIDCGGIQHVDLLQFALWDIPIEVIRDIQADKMDLPYDGLIISDIRGQYAEELEEKYDCQKKSSRFVLYYNE